MKKTLLTSLITVILSLSFLSTNAISETNVNRVFKIEAYKYDEYTKTYKLAQYGSAVSMGNGVILTNAHVVIDDEDSVLGHYRVCRTLDFRKSPECISVAKLKYYDKKNDLAYLTIDKPIGTGVSLSKKTVELGSLVKVYGYPVTGGDTITYTEGKISGFSQGMYKIDANIDSGNSGGGVFDKEGKLVGMAVAVKTGYSTLGYIIPLETIKKFQTKKGTSIKEYSQKTNSFGSYEKKLTEVQKGKTFENSILKATLYPSLGYRIHSYQVTDNDALFQVHFFDEKYENIISMYNIFLTGSVGPGAIDKYYKQLKKQNLQDEYSKNVFKISKKMYSGYPSLQSYYVDDENYGGVTLVVELSQNQLLVMNVESNDVTDESYQNAISFLLKGVTLKKNIVNKSPQFTSLFPNFNGKIQGFVCEQSIEGANFAEYQDISIEGPKEMSLTYYPGDTWKSRISHTYSYLKDDLYIHEYSVKQTKSGAYYSYLFSLNNETKKEDLDKKQDRYLIQATFIVLEEGKSKQMSLSFTFNNKESKAKIDTFLEGLSPIKGKNMPLGEAKVNFNMISKPEFEWAE